MDPLPGQQGSSDPRLDEEVAHLQLENQRQADQLTELGRDLEFAEDRAHRAHKRIKQLDNEVKDLGKQLREARDNGEKLRSERRTRIKSERQSTEAARELEKLKREYIKLDKRLQQMARRLVQAEGGKTGGRPVEMRVELAGLRQLGAGKVLGIDGEVTAEELGRIRRRFAAVFHPDRVNQLPSWVRVLCDEMLVVVNEACDRLGK